MRLRFPVILRVRYQQSQSERDVMAELLIRAGRNDHQVVADLLAPGGAVALHRPIDRLVADVQIAARRPQLAAAAATAGVPYLVDPLTPLLQGETDPADAWVRHAGFGRSDAIDPATISEFEIATLVADVVEAQQKFGATAIIPPYLIAASPVDPAYPLSLRMLELTARYMRHNGVSLPLLPVFCGQARTFTRGDRWREGIDRFTAAAADLGPQAVAICFTPLGADKDSYGKILPAFTAARRIKSAGMTTLAWHQGVLGPALVAAGLDGYETGIGTNEKSDLRGFVTRRAPKKRESRRGGGVSMVYIEPLGRSVKRDVAETLLGDRSMRARLICDDERCCPDGVHGMLDDSRKHTIRSRAGRLRDLEEMPHQSWRLHQIAKDARTAASLTKRATLVLQSAGMRARLRSNMQEALARVAEYLRVADEQRMTG
jgi:hypothetical protein